MFKILTFDGGGIRGVSQARLLQRIEQAWGRRLNPDLIAGTSIGGVVAAAYDQMTPVGMVEFFRREGPKVFAEDSFFDDVDDLWDLQGARYSNKPLKRALTGLFGGRTLAEVPRKIMITSFSLRHPEGFWQPVVFHNFTGQASESSRDLSIVQACMRTTAAPTYFPVYEKHCDGGVWGNNPSCSALALACDEYVGRQILGQCSVLSIGTGRNPLTLSGSKNDLGLLDWLKKGLIDILLDGNCEASHAYTRAFLRSRYMRIQWNLEEEIKLDDVSRLDELIEIADKIDIDPVLEWMRGFWV